MKSPGPSTVRCLRAVARKFGFEVGARAIFHRLTRSRHSYPSETSKCRARLSQYCTGYGIDVGFGGDAVVPHAIGMDMPQPYTGVGRRPVQLGGDASRLYWFADGTLDFVFSSHLLEDLSETAAVLREWLRVLRPGGRLVIYCPDEQTYRRHCAATGQPYNTHHVHADFSLAFVKREFASLTVPYRIIHESALVDIYSWEIVVQKLA